MIEEDLKKTLLSGQSMFEKAARQKIDKEYNP